MSVGTRSAWTTLKNWTFEEWLLLRIAVVLTVLTAFALVSLVILNTIIWIVLEWM